MFVFSFTNFYQFPICFPSFFPHLSEFSYRFPWFSPVFLHLPMIFSWVSGPSGSRCWVHGMAQGPSLCGKTRIMQTLTQALTEDMPLESEGEMPALNRVVFSGNSSPENPKCFMIYDDSWFPANVPWNKSIDFKWGVALNHPFGGPHFGGNLQIW